MVGIKQAINKNGQDFFNLALDFSTITKASVGAKNKVQNFHLPKLGNLGIADNSIDL